MPGLPDHLLPPSGCGGCSTSYTTSGVPPFWAQWADYPSVPRGAPPSAGNFDIFPLPRVAVVLGDCRKEGASAQARKRHNFRRFAQHDADSTTSSLNSLYGCSERFVGEPSPAQSLAVRRIVAACSKDRHDFDTVSVEESARRLLGARFNYSCSESCTVEDFDPGRIALPSLGGTPVVLKEVLDRDACEALHNFETRLLADPEVAEERFREGSVPRDSYFDKKCARTDPST